jgi:serine/threonine protein kinase
MQFIHGDIKLQNIVAEEDKKLFLIDFNSSVKFIDENNKHVNNLWDHKFPGNLMFASMNICCGSSLSRRDDIESIIYLMVYLTNNKILPWSQFQDDLI